MSSLKNLLNSVIFEETFESMGKIGLNSGVITGTPVIQNDEPVFTGGLDFDGSSDNIAYDGSSLFNGKGSISLEVWFKPDFAATDTVNAYLMDASSGSRYAIYHNTNGNLEIYLGNTQIVALASGSYSSNWNADAMNHIVVAGTTGATDVYLNNTKIVDADNSAWSAAVAATLYIGSKFSAEHWFNGTIYATRIYDKKLTTSDVSALYNAGLGHGTLLKDLDGDHMILQAPCKASYNDGSERPLLNQNYDYQSSYTATMGDGSTAGTFPTVSLDGHYSFDGSAEYLIINNNLYSGKTNTTTTHWIRVDSYPSANVGIVHAWVTEQQVAFDVNSSGHLQWWIDNAARVSYTTPIDTGRWIFLGWVSDGTNVKIYIDGVEVASSAYSTALPTSSQAMYSFRRSDSASYLGGDMQDLRIYDIALSPLQIEALYLKGPNNTNL